jgi:glucokinase
MNKYIYGVDVGGTFLKIGLFTHESHKLIDSKEVETPHENHEISIFQEIIKTINKINIEHNIVMNDVLGIGLAIPCPTKNGYVSTCANLNFCNIDLIQEFRALLPKHVVVTVGNDATLAALGENNSLETPYENAVLITLGTGVGGGVILNSNIIEGKTGLGGEIGHVKVFDTNEVCGCGAHGCLEQVCGTKGILTYALEQKNKGGSILKDGFTVKDVFDAAKQNDIAALNTVNRVAEYLAIAAVNIAVTIEPEVFIIGGGVSKAGDFLLDLIVYYFKKHARFNTGDIKFILASTGNDAGMIGSYYHAYQHIK